MPRQRTRPKLESCSNPLKCLTHWSHVTSLFSKKKKNSLPQSHSSSPRFLSEASPMIKGRTPHIWPLPVCFPPQTSKHTYLTAPDGGFWSCRTKEECGVSKNTWIFENSRLLKRGGFMCPLSVKMSFHVYVHPLYNFFFTVAALPNIYSLHIVRRRRHFSCEHTKQSEENEKEAGWGSRVQHRVVCVYFGNAALQTYSRGTDS